MNAADTETLLSAYDTLSATTGRMLTAARSGDWERLVGLEQDCASLVARLSSLETEDPLPSVLRDRKIALIRKVLADDAAIRDITERKRVEQLKEEFVQETELDIGSISIMKPLGLVKDFKNQVVDICCLIEVDTSSGEVLQNTLEYEDLAWIEQSAVESETFVPTSIALLNLFKDYKLCDTV